MSDEKQIQSEGCSDEMEWFDLRRLTKYAGLSKRTLHSWIHDPSNPLPASQVGSKILVRRRDFDRYLESHRIARSESLDAIVNSILDRVKAGS